MFYFVHFYSNRQPTMNKLLISNKDFFADMSWLEKPILGGFIPRKEFIDQYTLVMNILFGETLPNKITLRYPERFFPNNMSQHFWNLIKERMQSGIEFDVETSDLHAAIHIGLQKEVQTGPNSGWDIREILTKADNGSWERFSLQYVYGRSYSDVVTCNSF
jgi:hypothetical protein